MKSFKGLAKLQQRSEHFWQKMIAYKLEQLTYLADNYRGVDLMDTIWEEDCDTDDTGYSDDYVQEN